MKVDINLPSYSIITSNAAIYAIRRVSIKDNSLVQDGFIDHFGGTYEVTNSNRAQMEAILSQAPAMSGSAKVDEMNMKEKVANMVSLREMAQIFDTDSDIRFVLINQVKQAVRELNAWLTDMRHKKSFDLNYMLQADDENSEFQMLENLYSALQPLYNALKDRSEGVRTTSELANTLQIDSKIFGRGRVEEGISIMESQNYLSKDGKFEY